MRHPLILAGEGPAAAHARIQTERTELRAALDRIHAGLTPPAPGRPAIKRIAGRSAEDDHDRLRAIPIQTRGVPGHIPGTRP